MILLNDKEYTCPVDVTLGIIGGKWKLLILFHLHYFTRKSYSEIKANLPKISEKMLSQQLLEFERDGLTEKSILSLKPYRVIYSLTEKGKTLGPLCEFVGKWGVDYLMENGIDYNKDQNLYK